MATFTAKQVATLLRPLNPSRVEQRNQAGRALSYLSQADMRAHMIRLFGFGGFDAETLDTQVIFCEQNEKSQWQSGVLVTMRVTVRNPEGDIVCVYSESAVGSATLPQRGESLDMALKTASSDAFKRCCINLGDQAGLSLYQNGSVQPIVKDTLVHPVPVETLIHGESHGDEVGHEGMPLGDPTSEEEQA